MHAERKRLHGTALYEPKAPKLNCDIQGCPNPHFGRGYCLAHYKRLNKYGDPLAGGIKWGEAQKFLRLAVGFNGDECLTWPYGTSRDGYGRVNYKSVPSHAHVVVTTLAPDLSPVRNMRFAIRAGTGIEGALTPNT
jgi:hypothetical protein